MKYYAQVNNEGKVFAVSQIDCDLVKIDQYNPDMLGATYDPDTGEFSGYRVTLTASKRTIEVGQSAEITATIVNWDRTPCEYNGDVRFRINDAKQTVKASAGVAVLTYQANSPGEIEIRTDNDEFISNEYIMIEVTEPEPEEEGAAE